MDMTKLTLVLFLLIGSISLSTDAATIKPCTDKNCVDNFQQIANGAKRGHVDAITTLAQFYYFGYGTDIDREKAFVLFKKGARLGNLAAQYKTGLIYLSNDKFKNLDKGIRYLERASRRNYLNSTFLLGVVYMNKTFGLHNKEKADTYLTRSLKDKHQDMPVVVDYLTEIDELNADHYPKLFNALQDISFAKTSDNKSIWPVDETEVITITSPSIDTIVSQQVIAFRRPNKSTGSRLPAPSCRDSVGCYSTWGIEGLDDFTFLTTY